MIFCYSWSIPDSINTLVLLVSSIMAWVMYKTFKEGQKQTRQALAIDQFHIFEKELGGLLEEAGKIKFESYTQYEKLKPYKDQFDNANGIYYIYIFDVLNDVRLLPFDSEERRYLVDSFRHAALFPLTRYYDKLHHFLTRIDQDQILSDNYKKLLYNYVERDILQIYFRVCNYSFVGQLHCDLSVFETVKYKPQTFYKINQFFIDKNAFEFKSQAFYAENF